jgi:elongation factor G
VERSARVLDGAVVVIDAVAGVQAQTMTVWKQIKRQSIPAVAFVNKMDRDGASFIKAEASLRERLGVTTVPIQLPIGEESEFSGVVDLIGMNRIVWEPVAGGTTKQLMMIEPTVSKLTSDGEFYDAAVEARMVMLESVAELDAKFQDIYLEAEDQLTIRETDIISALRRLCLLNAVVPMLCGSALKGKGVHSVLDSILGFLPSPEDRPPYEARNITSGEIKSMNSQSPHLCALAFKVVQDKARGRMVFIRIYSGTLNAKQMLLNTTQNGKERINQMLRVDANEYEVLNTAGPGSIVCLIGLKNTVTGDTLVDERGTLKNHKLHGLSIPRAVYSVAIEPEKSSDQTRLEEALAILQIEDPSLQVEVNSESGQTLLQGIGELHIEIVCDKLKRQHNLEVCQSRAYVAFRESIADADKKSYSHTYDRTIGGKRMFAGLTVQITTGNLAEAGDCTFELDPLVRESLPHDDSEALLAGLKVRCDPDLVKYSLQLHNNS